MRILDRYIIRSFLTTFVFVLALFVVIAMVFDFSERVDDFIDQQAPVKAIIFDYYLNFIPYLANLFSPLFIFISVIYFTSRMAYNNEIIAILASGINFYRLLVPYILVAALLTGISYYFNGYVIPAGNKDLVAFEMEYIRSGHRTDEINIHRQTAPGEFIFMQSYHNKDSTGRQFTLENFEGKNLTYKLSAKKIQWRGETNDWEAQDYHIREIDGKKESIRTGKTKTINIDIHPDDFSRTETTIQMMTNDNLDQAILQERLRGSRIATFYEVEREKRNALPFSTVILVLMGVSIASRKVKGGMGMHLGLGILLAFSYLMLLQFSTTFALNANFPTRLSVWLPNILYAILGVTLMFRAPK